MYIENSVTCITKNTSTGQALVSFRLSYSEKEPDRTGREVAEVVVQKVLHDFGVNIYMYTLSDIPFEQKSGKIIFEVNQPALNVIILDTDFIKKLDWLVENLLTKKISTIIKSMDDCTVPMYED